MIKIFISIIALIILLPSIAFSDNYSVYVRRVESNEDSRQNIIIKTSMCLELSIGDNAILIGNNGYSGKLIFLNYSNEPKTECYVNSVYAKIKF